MPTRKPELSNEVKSLNPQCKIVIYPWAISTSEAGDAELGFSTTSGIKNDSDLSDSNPLDISSQVLNFTYSKNMDSPSGTFNFQLANGEKTIGDWKDIIKRGTWCVVYLSQEGNLAIKDTVSAPLKGKDEYQYLRCVGYIDRVAVTSSMSETGAYDVTFSVSGRDFGVVYEDTTIWHNLFQFDQIMLQSLTDSKLNQTGATTLNEVLSLIHNLFFNPDSLPGAKTNDEKSLTSIALQWLLPRKLLVDLQMQNQGNDSFWGRLGVINFQKTKATLAVESTTAFLTGNAWEQLKRLSSPAFHELFTEIDDLGYPTLTFRPIPFAMNKKNYPNVGEYISLYKDLNYIDVRAIDVIDFDLGEDCHSRYNSFLATLETTLYNESDNITFLRGEGFPKFIQASIKRHGFRPMHVTVDNIIKDSHNGFGTGAPILLKEFNEALLDYWAYSTQAESGFFNLVGRFDVKVGKCMVTAPDVPYAGKKRYYIEGYTDTFSIDDLGNATWMQQVEVTRGFSEDALKNTSRLTTKFNHRTEPVKTSGEFTKKGGK